MEQFDQLSDALLARLHRVLRARQVKQGRIWVATNGAGVALFLGDSEGKSAKKFKNFLIVNDGKAEDLKRYNAVNRMLVDSQNDLWVLTDGGLFRASLSDPVLKFSAV